MSWPEKGDRLFVSGGATTIRESMPLLALAMAYKIAGDAQATRVLRADTSEDKALLILALWPTVLCYRHSIELALKHCVYQISTGNGHPKTHDLRRLWRRVADVIRSRHEHDDAFDAMEACIDELVVWDPTGQSFRYPERDGVWVKLDHEQQGVDLRHLMSRIDRVFNYLVACADWFEGNTTLGPKSQHTGKPPGNVICRAAGGNDRLRRVGCDLHAGRTAVVELVLGNGRWTRRASPR